MDDKKLMKAYSLNTIKGIKQDLAALESKIMSLIKPEDQVLKQYKIVTSVSGVGPVTGINIIAITKEFKDISEAKKFAF